MNYLLIGLGNPGKKYVSTRHNAGRMFAAWLKEEGRGKREEGDGGLDDFEIAETDCYMNQSGEWLARYLARKAKGQRSKAKGNTGTPVPALQPSAFSLQPLFIAHDDLDLPLGSFKIQFGRGPQLHKGILSIEKALGTKDFWRVRIGVDNRKGQLSSAKISQHPPAIAFGDSRWRAGQIADKSTESDSGLSDLIRNPISADASRSKPAFPVSGEEYVLRPFKREEKIILKQTFRSIKSALLKMH